MNRHAALRVGLLALMLMGCGLPNGPTPGPGVSMRGGPTAAEAAAASGARSEPAVASRPEERIVIAMPVVSGIYLPYMVARDQGYFREEGLTVEFPVMRANLAVTAVTVGEADFNGMIGPSIPPILAGQPQRVLAGVVVKSTRELTAVPEIQSIDQLRGKVIGIGSIGGGPYNSGLIALQAHGMDPLRDVTWLQLGGTVERLAAMQQGAIQASIFSSSEIPRARALGFPAILRLDEVAPLPESGLATSLTKLETNRAQVKRVLRALVRGLQLTRSDRDGALPTVMEYLELPREEAVLAYDAIAYAYSADGTVPERTLRFAIDAEKASVNVTEEVPFARVVEFAPLYEVLAEMHITPAPDSAR